MKKVNAISDPRLDSSLKGVNTTQKNIKNWRRDGSLDKTILLSLNLLNLITVLWLMEENIHSPRKYILKYLGVKGHDMQCSLKLFGKSIYYVYIHIYA